MKSENRADLIGKVIVIVLIAVFVAVGIFSMLGGGSKGVAPGGMPMGMPGGMPRGNDTAETAVTVSVKTVTPETIQKTVLLNGNVTSKTETNIYPDTSGKVTRVLKNVGDSVRRGEIIAYVDPSKPGSAYAASPVTATVAGTIIQLPYHMGDTVSTNTSLAVIGSLRDLEITLNVSEKYSAYLRTGLPAYVSLVSAPEQEFMAKVTSVSPVVNSSNRTQQVTLELDDGDERIRPGMFAQVRLVIMEVSDTIVVPQSAIKDFNGTPTVFIVGEDDRARRVTVTTGISNDADIQVTSGLVTGDRVITAGSVTEGSKIKIAGTPTGGATSEPSDAAYIDMRNTD